MRLPSEHGAETQDIRADGRAHWLFQTEHDPRAQHVGPFAWSRDIEDELLLSTSVLQHILMITLFI